MGARGARGARTRGSGAARAAFLAFAAFAALAALAAPTWAKKRRLNLLGVATANNCSWGPGEDGSIEMKFTGVGLSQLFSEAPRRGAGNTTIPGLLEIFTMNRIKKLKNVAVTGWDLTGGVEAPVYLVGILAESEWPVGGNEQNMNLGLFQSDAQKQASTTPPTGSAARCSVFFDKRKNGRKLIDRIGGIVNNFPVDIGWPTNNNPFKIPGPSNPGLG